MANAVGDEAANPSENGSLLQTGSPRPRYTPAFLVKLWGRLARPSADPDRSAELDHEPRGHLDKLDLWVVLVLVVALLALRVPNLGQPTAMYFDEVYHARTATEFLQDWRYGINHDIYEWTHPPAAKYAIAAGIALFSDDQVNATGNLGVPVKDAVVQERTANAPNSSAASANESLDYSSDYGDRVLVATGSQVRVYDLVSRTLAYTYSIPGVQTLSAPDTGGLVYAGTAEGAIFALDTNALDALRAGQVSTVPAPARLPAEVGFPITRLFAGLASYLLASGPSDQVASIDLGTDTLLRSGSIPGVADFASPGPGLLGTAAKPQVLVAYRAGVGLLDVRGLTIEETIPTASPATSLALNPEAIATNTYRYYVAAGKSLLLLKLDRSHSPAVLSKEGSQPLAVMPGVVSRVIFDEGTGIVQVLGQSPDGAGPTVYAVESHGNAVFSDARLPFIPVAFGLDNAVSVSGLDAVSAMPAANREALLAFGSDGALASVDVGQFAFSWRIVGLLFGLLMAVCLYLLARLLFRRRSVGLLVAALCALDGLAFVQSRIAMNDTYVGGLLVAAYLIFALLWLRIWRGRAAFWLGMPALGVILGLALVSKWVAIYAIAGIGILILIRSALGRLLVVLGLIAGTGVLGWQAIAEMQYQPASGNVPLCLALIIAALGVAVAGVVLAVRTAVLPDKVFLGSLCALLAAALAGGALAVSPAPLNNGAPDYTFFLIMLAITALATALAVLHPVAWTREELRFALLAPALFGLLTPVLLALLVLPIGAPFETGAVLRLALIGLGAGVALGAAAAAAFWAGGWVGFGPLARHHSGAPPDPAPEGWLRLGSGAGLPAAWTAFCLALLPLAVYVVLYIPWAMPSQAQTASTGPLPAIACWQVDPASHLCADAWPAGHTGQNLPNLTSAMYTYHNDLRDSHPAASPWWAWPLDLKPVWFAGGSAVPGASSVIYDAGNPVLWWLAIAAMIFACWQALRRRSLGLALIAVAFFWQWLSWARIDREAFQYHFYTALPFFLLGLAYFLAELWHGPSARTWLAARAAGAAVALTPGLLWLLEPELCGLVRVNAAGLYQQAVCGTGLRTMSLDLRSLLIGGVGLAAVVGLVLIVRRSERPGANRPWLVPMTALFVLACAALGALRLLAPNGSLSVALPPTWPTVFWLLSGGILAYFSLSARRPRRFVAAVLMAAGLALAALYPYLSALWLPNAWAGFYALLSPTWQYGFQFATNMQAGFPVKLISSGSASAIFLAAALAFAVAMVVSACRALGHRNSEVDGLEPKQEEPIP